MNELIDNLAAKLIAAGNYIEPHSSLNSISALEQRLPSSLPPSFHSLVTRYSFLPFKIESLELFGNIPGEAQNWLDCLFADKALSSVLLTNGYIQFARPDTGSYDPICFDTKRSDEEYPIVWIEHEGILCYDRIIIRTEIAPSFVHLVQAYLASG